MTQLAYSNRPYFDHGAIKEISVVLENLGIKKPLICTDPGLAELGMIDQLRNQLSNEISPSFYDQTPANPTEGTPWWSDSTVDEGGGRLYIWTGSEWVDMSQPGAKGIRGLQTL